MLYARIVYYCDLLLLVFAGTVGYATLKFQVSIDPNFVYNTSRFEFYMDYNYT